MISAVIFDFDGLILDTETHEYHVLQEIYKEHGTDLPLEVWGKVIGTQAGFDAIAYLEDRIGKKLDKNQVQKNRRQRFNDRIKNEGPLPGVKSYLDTAKKLGYKIGPASSSDYAWVSTHLKNLGLLEYFECIRTKDDVEKVKPDPSLYLQTAECLGVKPNECIVFEDSANGAQAAKLANMYCVVIPNTVTKNLAFDKVDHMLESMAHMELEELIAKVLKN